MEACLYTSLSYPIDTSVSRGWARIFSFCRPPHPRSHHPSRKCFSTRTVFPQANRAQSYRGKAPGGSIYPSGGWVNFGERYRRGRHVAKDHQRKLRTTRGLPRPIAIRYSEGISYKPHCGEVGMRRRVGRMGPVKRRGPGQHNPVGARAPGVERTAARMEVLISTLPLTPSRDSRWKQRARRTKANPVNGEGLARHSSL